MSVLFELRNAGVRYGTFDALRSVSLDFQRGEFVAVAGPSPGLATVSYDLERVGLETAPTEVRSYGDVECLVRNLPSGEPGEADAFVEQCQRSSEDLTVRVLFPSGDLAEDPETVAGYVDEAFDSLG